MRYVIILIKLLCMYVCMYNISDTANKSATSWQQIVVMEFGKHHDTTDTTDFCPHQLFTDLLRTCRLCCGLVTGKPSTCYGLNCYGETGVMGFGLYMYAVTSITNIASL